MSPELKNFINENINLINQNTKESWEKIYDKLHPTIKTAFTETIFDARINDPASILEYVPAWYLCESKISNYKIPNNVKSIHYGAFYECNDLTSVTIPNSVAIIESRAFQGCSRLTSIVIPDSVKEIRDYAFSYCDSLTSIVIPDSVIEIQSSAFYACDSLTSVVIGNGVTEIEKHAFEYCDNLTSVVLPNSIRYISDYTFAYCGSLKEIKFKGTKKQAITLGIGNGLKKKWRENSAIQKIICTDGEIEL